MIPYLFLPYARRLAAKGEFDKALLWSNCRDARILSAADMHGKALNIRHCPLPQRIKALFLLGETEEALTLLQKFPDAAFRGNLWGILASAMPDATLALPNTPPRIKDWCRLELDDFSPNSKPPEDIFLQWKWHIRNGRYEEITPLVKKIFHQFQLEPPILQWGQKGVTCHTSDTPRSLMQKGPLVSIIMTAYNEERHIGMAIDSILGQTYSNFELLIVDDASTDQTVSIIKQKASEDARIKFLPLASNKGTWSGKNKALSLAHGDFIMMHDADDWSHPDKLHQMLTSLQKGKAQAVSSRILRLRETSGEPFALDVNNFIRWNPSSFLFRRSFIERYGPYLNLLGSDCELVARHEMISGVAAHIRLKLPLSLGFAKQTSLSLKFRGKTGGKQRIADWEQWRLMHVAYLKDKSILWKK